MFSPITYNTDINSVCLNYLTGGATYGSGIGGNWSNNFSEEFLYTFGNGYARPGVNNFTYNNNIFSGDNNWCNWQGGTNNNSLFNINPYTTFPQYGDGFGYKSLFSNQEWCNWHGKSSSISSTPSTPSVSPTSEKSSASEASKASKSSTTKPVKEDSKPSQAHSSQEVKTSSHANKNTTIGEKMVKDAFKYRKLNEADGSWRKISNSKEWCADFIYYVIDETYKEQGKQVPKGLEKALPAGQPHHRVEELKQWGIDNGKYFSIANKKNKGKLVAENVKIGDILILREDGASHTGFVTKVYPDGVFETIEGNRNDKVCRVRYSPNYHEISGFVQLT